ncbi:heavy-metal-associated domain-containing protein [Sphaerimonospora sp. CA-214678]|uniref:heavy-metal-associated domain-containing protein n=1 Tax=Sphaerimonospora sp. CA-214678 TaxID=3240029 RepID=UPI003D91BB17
MCSGCSCGTQDQDGTGTTPAVTPEDSERIYDVTGMTCGHCVSSVSTEIGKVGGVSGVQVDLTSGAVTVSGSGFSDDEIRAAVEQAGYQLAGAGS